jgi:hypothetical protein
MRMERGELREQALDSNGTRLGKGYSPSAMGPIEISGAQRAYLEGAFEYACPTRSDS